MNRPNRARRLAVACAASLWSSPPVATTERQRRSDSPSGDESSERAHAEPTGDGTLTIGTLLPQTGDLAFLGPPEFAGVQLAVEEINEAGGVLGKPVEKIDADSGDGTPDIAGARSTTCSARTSTPSSAPRPRASRVTVIDKITGAGVVQFSPANTAAGFDTYEDNGLYFRTAPSDVLQGQVLGNLAVEDGFENVAIMARQDFYGEGLAEQVQTRSRRRAPPSRVRPVLRRRHELHRRGQQDRRRQARRARPDRLQGDDQDHPAADRQRHRPQDIQIYFVDGNLADYSKESFDLTGVKGTMPGRGRPGPGLQRPLLEVDPSSRTSATARSPTTPRHHRARGHRGRGRQR